MANATPDLRLPFQPQGITVQSKNVKVAHTRLPSVGFRSWSRILAVSLQVTWVINLAVGCHYFPPGQQLLPQPLIGLLPTLLFGEQRHNGCEPSPVPNYIKLHRLETEAHVCEQLAQGCCRKRAAGSRTRDLHSRKSNALTTTPPPGHKHSNGWRRNKWNVLMVCFSAVCSFINVSFRTDVSAFWAFLSSRHSSALYCFYCIVSVLMNKKFNCFIHVHFASNFSSILFLSLTRSPRSISCFPGKKINFCFPRNFRLSFSCTSAFSTRSAKLETLSSNVNTFIKHTGWITPQRIFNISRIVKLQMIRYDTKCYFSVRSKAAWVGLLKN